MTHAYGINNGVEQYEKFATKKTNLLFLQELHGSHGVLKITNRHSVERYAPREKRIGKFEDVILHGIVDWYSLRRYETKIELGHYKARLKW